MEKLLKEVEFGRMAGPFREPPFGNLLVSPLGLVPKKEPGKFRLIHHLSFPAGDSVNDGITKEQAAVSYASFDRAVYLVRRAGAGAMLAKADIESAFRLLPVHPDCFHLLGCRIEGYYFVDMCLPMGCSISCYYFEVFSSFLEWMLRFETDIPSVLHYLDDFLFVGPPEAGVCGFLLASFQKLMRRAGVPLSAEKTVGPVTSLEFLGIEIDTREMVFRLPEEKIARLRQMVETVSTARKVTLHQMQVLLGLLNFACRVIPMGRAFSRRLSLATKGAREPHHFVRVTKEMKADLHIWKVFLETFNGQVICQREEVDNEELGLVSDASGACGFGVIFGNRWCNSGWPEAWVERGWTRDIALLEIFPIMVAIELWGPVLANRSICFWSDNQTVVRAVNKQSSASKLVLAALRHLVLCCLQHNIKFKANHVPGHLNNKADALSRFQMSKFRELHPTADVEGVQTGQCGYWATHTYIGPRTGPEQGRWVPIWDKWTYACNGTAYEG
ncbi:uncharacterized protein [Eleutherodactylus coqui]|uniref:uncharacterized protein isoform X2 n=1 Tax=Eleutherodactylus coqui TaxID=57060 RepID=UPI003462650A